MSHLEDDGGLSSDFIAVETPADVEKPQSLWVAVRHGYHGNDPDGELIVQILYQEKHMDSVLAGPVFLSVETWRELNRAVERRLRDRRPSLRKYLARRRAIRHAMRQTFGG